MTSVMIFLILLISANSVFGQSQTVTCSTYNSSQNSSSMILQTVGNQNNIVIGQCPNGQAPGPPQQLQNSAVMQNMLQCIQNLQQSVNQQQQQQNNTAPPPPVQPHISAPTNPPAKQAPNPPTNQTNPPPNNQTNPVPNNQTNPIPNNNTNNNQSNPPQQLGPNVTINNVSCKGPQCSVLVINQTTCVGTVCNFQILNQAVCQGPQCSAPPVNQTFCQGSTCTNQTININSCVQQYLPQQQGTPLQSCQPPLPVGATCNGSYPQQCSTGICVNAICTAPATNGSCGSDADCADGFFCKNGLVTPSLIVGGPCSNISPLECYRGVCLKSNLTCVSFATWYNMSNFPAVIGADLTGFKNCTPATVNTDCLYNTSSGVQTATQLGFSCLPTLYAPVAQYFCQIGGGEPPFLYLAMSHDKRYNRTQVSATIPLFGSGANSMKNTSSCVSGASSLPNFITSSGFTPALQAPGLTTLVAFANPFATLSVGLILSIIVLLLFA